MNESSEPDILFHGAEWFDQNKGKLMNGALAVIVAVAAYLWINKSQTESNAASESALFDVQNLDSTNLVEIAGAYAKVSDDQAGKPVAERALILSARTWLEAANYDKAQTAFESYLRQYANGHWATEAKLGQAICQETKEDAAAAISTYQSLTNNASAAIQNRAAALLEAAQTKLEPLAAKATPAAVLQPEASKPGTPVASP
ncbi:uncharacterized protein METZ01_LOCUS256359, partial [marine metagenome]